MGHVMRRYDFKVKQHRRKIVGVDDDYKLITKPTTSIKNMHLYTNSYAEAVMKVFDTAEIIAVTSPNVSMMKANEVKESLADLLTHAKVEYKYIIVKEVIYGNVTVEIYNKSRDKVILDKLSHKPNDLSYTINNLFMSDTELIIFVHKVYKKESETEHNE